MQRATRTLWNATSRPVINRRYFTLNADLTGAPRGLHLKCLSFYACDFHWEHNVERPPLFMLKSNAAEPVLRTIKNHFMRASTFRGRGLSGIIDSLSLSVLTLADPWSLMRVKLRPAVLNFVRSSSIVILNQASHFASQNPQDPCTDEAGLRQVKVLSNILRQGNINEEFELEAAQQCEARAKAMDGHSVAAANNCSNTNLVAPGIDDAAEQNQVNRSLFGIIDSCYKTDIVAYLCEFHTETSMYMSVNTDKTESERNATECLADFKSLPTSEITFFDLRFPNYQSTFEEREKMLKSVEDPIFPNQPASGQGHVNCQEMGCSIAALPVLLCKKLSSLPTMAYIGVCAALTAAVLYTVVESSVDSKLLKTDQHDPVLQHFAEKCYEPLKCLLRNLRLNLNIN